METKELLESIENDLAYLPINWNSLSEAKKMNWVGDELMKFSKDRKLFTQKYNVVPQRRTYDILV